MLLLDKPPGLSSNAALQRAKRLYAAEKAGHTGTLDPLATGLLPLCFGEATKFAQALLDARKEYVATVRFGVATTTGDAEGEVVANVPSRRSRATTLEAALPRFIGTIAQVPPAHSALKFEGAQLLRVRARRRRDRTRTPREVEIDAIELVDWAPPDAVLRVACSKGTYIRVLAEDIGARARQLRASRGAAAHRERRRSRSTDAVTLDALEAIDARRRATRCCCRPTRRSPAMPRLDVDVATAQALRAGTRGSAPADAPRRAISLLRPPARFLGLVEASTARCARCASRGPSDASMLH